MATGRLSASSARIVFGLMALLVVFGHGVRADPPPRDDKRLALVIGNGSYMTSPLATSVNDAGLVAQTLAQAGFDVTAAANADAGMTRKLFSDFATKLQASGPDAVAFVYLAGYGLQYAGDDFFVPVDAKITRDVDVPTQAVPFFDLARSLQATPARARIFIYDLARAGPFPETGLPLASGLNITASPNGTLTATNTSPGTVAEPDMAPYGIYARALAEMIQMPGLQANDMFKRVRLRVAERTNGGQIAYASGSVDFAFYPGANGVPAATAEVPIINGMPIADAFAICISRDVMSAFNEFVRAFPNDPLAARVRRMIAVRREAQIWGESLQANTARVYWTYMRRYPRGPHFGDARRKLAELNAALEPPPRFDVYDYFDLPPPTADEVALVGKRNVEVANAAMVAIPPVPPSLLPPAREAFFDDLPPPPILPEDILPVPMPIALPTGSQPSNGFGPISQPDVPGFGAITTDTRGTTVTVDGDGRDKDKRISQTIASIDHGIRTLVQTGDHDNLISRTTTTHDQGAIVIVQRDTSGRVLTESVTRSEPDGLRTTTLLDGRSQLIGRITADKNGVVKTVDRGSVPVGEQVWLLQPGADGASKPQVITLAHLHSEFGTSRKDQETVDLPRPPVPAPTLGGEVAPKLAKMPSMQSSSMPDPASPGTPPHAHAPAAPAQQRELPGRSPSSTSPGASPTGGATLSAIPPMLRQAAAAPGQPPPSLPPSTVLPSTRPLIEPAPPSIATVPTQPFQSKTGAPSATAAASPIVPGAATVAPAPAEPKPPTVAAFPPPSTAPHPSSSTVTTSVPLPAETGPKPPTSVTTRPPPPAAGLPLAPSDAPPSRPGPPTIEAEMLMPSKKLPTGFEPAARPSPTAPTAAGAPLTPASSPVAAPSPPVSAPAQPSRTSPALEKAVVAPPIPSSRLHAEASASSNATTEPGSFSPAALPADPPLPPHRPVFRGPTVSNRRPPAKVTHRRSNHGSDSLSAHRVTQR